MSTTTTILLKNGTALIHRIDDEGYDVVDAVKTDILIEGDTITKIEPNISGLPSNTDIINCTNKIVSPGFVDTHHHVWQTQLRGKQANDTLLNYFARGLFPGSFYTPDDVFWGELGGCMELLDAGTTTVVDYANINYSALHNHRAVAALSASGLRATYCYTVQPRLTSWAPFAVAAADPLAAADVYPTLHALHATLAAHPRIALGFAFDGLPYLPADAPALAELRATLAALAVPLVTLHYIRGALMGHRPLARMLEANGSLDGRVLLAHASPVSADEARLYRERGVHVATTPSTEFQMGMGFPAPSYDPVVIGALEPAAAGAGGAEADATDGKGAAAASRRRRGLHAASDLCGLGVDCHSATSAYLPLEARLALQAGRAHYATHAYPSAHSGRFPLTLGGFDVERAFTQLTLGGARAAKMGHVTGSLEVGKKADVIVLDGRSVGMLGAAEEDPVAAVVGFSSARDVEVVIVDGVVRKKGGKVLGVEVEGREGGALEWEDVAAELVKSRERLMREMDKVDLVEAEKAIMDMFHLNPKDFGDEV